MKFQRLRRFFLAGFCVLPCAMALAQSYPNRPIRIIVPYTPGDGPDVIARLIGNKISERLGQPVVVDNKAGASSQIGLDLTAKSAPVGTPHDIVHQLNDEINRAIRLPEVQKSMSTLGLIPQTGTPEDFGRLLKSDYDKFGKLVKDIGYQPQ
ncbi:MAG: hypothetical protein RIT26_1890 [Pseudomonadota bacterium]|jgi:tripartite-type tricarboxylate transporter receptor subunit TctC